MQKDDSLQVEVKVIDPDLASRLIESNVKSQGYFELTDQDFNEMLDKFHALERHLKQEGLIRDNGGR
ncbi:hypothetical protein ACFQRK_22085 [Parapedobacter sp. GCM10030251]|uniref:hypothetical protein n=1 Tax=Parapedobacter sp. GCM10030251 TaxID=3273419 RepID=UPI00361E8245